MNNDRFKAEVLISGAWCESVYGTKLETVRKSAVAKLTCFEPGLGNLWPKHVRIHRHICTISGNRADWEWIESIPFSLVPEDQRDYVKRRKTSRQPHKTE